jgi:hypothetical protein
MAITAHFNDKNDIAAGGEWFDDYGRSICSWIYDPATREIEVMCGPTGKRMTLPAIMNETDLNSRLARLAIEAAEQIRGVKYDV